MHHVDDGSHRSSQIRWCNFVAVGDGGDPGQAVVGEVKYKESEGVIRWGRFNKRVDNESGAFQHDLEVHDVHVAEEVADGLGEGGHQQA